MRVTFLLAAAGAASAYMLGDETQLCWEAGVLVGENLAQCAPYGGIELNWTIPPEDEIYVNEGYNISCSIYYDSAQNISMGDDGNTPIAHINIHSCDSSITFCEPSIANTIATHSPAQKGLAGDYIHELKLDPVGIWASICHGRIFIGDPSGALTKIDGAIAKLGISVVERPPPPDQTYIYIICGVVGGVLIIALISAIFIVRHIKNNKAIIKYKDLQYDPTKIFKETGVSIIFIGSYMGTEVAIKQIKSKKQIKEGKISSSNNSNVGSEKRTVNLKSNKSSGQNTLNLKSSSNQVVPSSSTSAGQSTVAINDTMSQDGLKAIKTEINLLNDIRHPNCVLFLGAAYHDNTIFMVTEYMSHGALGEILVNPSILIDFTTKMKIAVDMSNGVNYLHSLKPSLLHADIKSYNVFVNADLRGKLGDFGSATIEAKKTRIGTPFWMAPELLNGGYNTPQTDVYALAITYWELFSRQELYPELHNTPIEELAVVIKEGTRPSLKSFTAPEKIKDFMERAWHASPEARPSTQECYDFFKNLLDDTDFMKAHVEKKNADNNELLYKILPPEIANQLRNGEKVKPIDCPEVTILFSDIVGFTNISATLDPKDVMNMLSRLYNAFDALTTKHNLFKVETIGDAYMVAGGIFDGQDEQAEKIALQGLAMIRAADKILIKEDQPELGTIKIRVGCHTGPIVASVVGDLNPRFCLFGDTVNFASRMESTSLKQRFQCTKVTERRLKQEAPHFVTEARGVMEVKGKGKVSTYFIQSENPAAKSLSEEFPHNE